MASIGTITAHFDFLYALVFGALAACVIFAATAASLRASRLRSCRPSAESMRAIMAPSTPSWPNAAEAEAIRSHGTAARPSRRTNEGGTRGGAVWVGEVGFIE